MVVPVNPKTPYYFARPGDPIPEYHAAFPEPFIALAKAIATLDFLSDGRFVFGVGGGWLRDEAEVMGVDFRRRWPMVVEYLRAMKELWTKREASFKGEFVNFIPVRCYPKPMQKPHPPIHIGAGDHKGPCDRALRNTVAVADGWMPTLMSPERMAKELAILRRMCEDAGRDFNTIEISIALGWQYTKPEARALVKEYAAIGVHRVIPTIGATMFDEDPAIVEKLGDAFLG